MAGIKTRHSDFASGPNNATNRQEINLSDLATRKGDHINLTLSHDVEMKRRDGFEVYHFTHKALPEIDFGDVSVRTTFLNHSLQAPVLISSMTGGTEHGAIINRNLASAARSLGIAMAVGSQRIMLEQPDIALSTFQIVRQTAPDIPLFGNLGAIQLNNGYGVEHVKRAVSAIGAQGIFLHLNPLQEVVQPEGQTNFGGLLSKIAAVVRNVPFPVLVKEVGNGISPQIAKDLEKLGVAAIDVSGAGGTSWAKIEGLRATQSIKQALGDVFRDWGIATPQSVIACRAQLPQMPLIASGGIRTGLDAAKALALGADMVSIARPLVAPALESAEAVVGVLKQFILELRVAMFLVGAPTIGALKQSPLTVSAVTAFR